MNKESAGKKEENKRQEGLLVRQKSTAGSCSFTGNGPKSSPFGAAIFAFLVFLSKLSLLHKKRE